MMLKIRRFHIFRSVCAAILLNMDTLRHTVIDNSTTVHFLFGEDAFHKETVSLYSCMSYFCCLCLRKGWKTGTKVVLDKFTVL